MALQVQVPGIRAFPTTVRALELILQSLVVLPDAGSTGTAALQDDAVTNAKLRNSGALSVIGRAANTTGDPADISATVADTFLVRRGTALGFGPLVDADIPATLARDSEVTSAVSAEATARDTAIATAVSTHEAAGNPHPVYLTQAEGDALYQPLATVLSMLHTGTGSPESVVTATVGHLYLRSDGGAGTTLYVKESGSGNTGWIGK